MSAIKVENIFKDYLKYYMNINYKKKHDNFIIADIDNVVYMSEGHILAVLDKELYKIPFITNTTPDMSRMIDKYADKECFVNNEMTINIGGINCYIINDIFGNNITYINKKMFDNWFDIKQVNLVMSNLDNKTPVYVKQYNKIIGLILPIRKVV